MRKLRVRNYQVDTNEGHYYLTDGINSLKRFARRNGIDFKILALRLLKEKQVVCKNETITMI